MQENLKIEVRENLKIAKIHKIATEVHGGSDTVAYISLYFDDGNYEEQDDCPDW